MAIKKKHIHTENAGSLFKGLMNNNHTVNFKENLSFWLNFILSFPSSLVFQREREKRYLYTYTHTERCPLTHANVWWFQSLMGPISLTVPYQKCLWSHVQIRQQTGTSCCSIQVRQGICQSAGHSPLFLLMREAPWVHDPASPFTTGKADRSRSSHLLCLPTFKLSFVTLKGEIMSSISWVV